MRDDVAFQPDLTPVPVAHERALEYDCMSDIIDERGEIVELVHRDLTAEVKSDVGRPGMAAEQVLRAAIAKQLNGFSYETLAFHLADSRTLRRFCRLSALDERKLPSSNTLWSNIARIQPETWESINRLILGSAKTEGVEDGQTARFDCTVTETNIHSPDDSAQLWDSVRVLTRLMRQNHELFGGLKPLFSDHTKRAKRRYVAIQNAKSATKRRPLYEDLLKVTRKTVRSAERVADALAAMSPTPSVIEAETELRHFIGLALRVIDQTQRRVIEGEKVPASEKIVSIFEPHTDIIIKSHRETEFGHKLCLGTGTSSMVTDCVVLDGNPADSTLATSMVERHEEIYDAVPNQVAFDGGFASKDNLTDIKALGVVDVMFNKKRGLAVEDMVKSTWIYRKLSNFRAGIEGVISFLKRCLGLTRCTYRNLVGFKRYVWSSIVSANLLIYARHRLA